MPEAEEVKKLKERIAELEQQLEEEREEMEWDLKAAREASNATIKKLEKDLEEAKKSSPPASSGGSTKDAEVALQRALMAERKVAELQHELKRARESAPKISQPNEDQVMRQRAESAEKERDDLRKQNRTLERTLAEKDRALSRAENKAENTAELKRQMEEVRRELLAKERELSRLKTNIDKEKQSDQDSEQLRKQLSEAMAQLDEKNENLGLSQARVRELADEISYLKEQKTLVEKEKEDLKATVEELRKKSSDDQKSSARVSELESHVSDLEKELAHLKMASSQMLEQREREAERLKTDLNDIQSTKTKDSKRVTELEAKNKSMEHELSVVRAERDEAVSALRRFRDGESTVVGKPGDVPKQQQLQQEDPFEESTKRVSMRDLPGADRSLDSTQPNLPATSNGDESQPVVPGELIADDSDEEAFPEPSDSDAEALDLDQAQGLRKTDKFTSKSTHPGEPPPLEPSEPGKPESSEGQDENILAQGKQEHDEQSLQTDEDNGSSAMSNVDESADDAEALDSPDDNAPDDLEVEWLEEGEKGNQQESASAASASSKGMPMALKWGLIAIGGLAGIGAVIAGALYFFPLWFGTQGVELENPKPESVKTDSTLSSSSAEPTTPDGGLTAVASSDGSSVADAGSPSDSSAAQDEGPNQDQEQQEPVHELSPNEKAALHAAQKHGLKLLKKKKYKLALRFLAPWVERQADDPVLRYLYGRALFYRKKIDAAKSQLEKAVELKHDYADAWYELIGIYAKLKDKTKTKEAMKNFLSSVPKKDRRARSVTAGLKKLERRP